MIRYNPILAAMIADRRGVTALEYGLVGSVLFGVVFLGFIALADSLSGSFSNIGATLAANGP